MEDLVRRLETVTAKLESFAQSNGANSAPLAAKDEPQATSASLKAFDDLVASHFSPLKSLGEQIGGLVAEQVRNVFSLRETDS
jgi:adenylyl cyclase-associated protein